MKKSKRQKTYTGVNIQFPISQLILSGEKTIETRTYRIPKKYIGQEMLLIETPGRLGRFKARAVAVIRFGEPVKYKSKTDFYKDFDRHRVEPGSPWAWRPSKTKWGWPVKVVETLARPIEIQKRIGILYTTEIFLQ